MNNNNFESAVFAAARARQPEALRLLLFGKSGQSSKELVEEEKLSSCLVDKMPELNPKDIRDLVAKGADINFRSSQGWIPLTSAVFWGKEECVECLIKLPAAVPKVRLSVDLRDTRGRTALHVAARKGRAAVILLLVGARADVNAQDMDGWTPLHHAVFNSQSESVVALISAWASLLVKDVHGFTPYMLMVNPGRTETSLSKEAIEVLQPPESVNFAKKLLPILKDPSLTPYAKVDELLNLPGVCGQFANLRLYDQVFSRMRGPNKIQLGKFWELLCSEMLQRLRSEKADLDTNRPCTREREKSDLQEELTQRQELQRRFVAAWLGESRGPPQSSEWIWDNREGYREALLARVQEEVEGFAQRSAAAVRATQVMPGYDELAELPRDEVLLPQYLDQQAAHRGMEWLTAADAVGAFEALRDVQALGDRGDTDDREALTRFMDLISADPDFLNGPAFWQNVYKLWLERYARLVGPDFQAKLRRFVANFSKDSGFQANLHHPLLKSYAHIKAHEGRLGSVGFRNHAERSVASRMLDIIGCSITVDCPEAIVALVKAFRDAGNHGSKWGKFELVRLQSSFCPDVQDLPRECVRSVVLHVLYHGGARHLPRTSGQLQVCIVGEVTILLPEFLEIKKSMDPLVRFLEEESESQQPGPSVSTPNRPSRRRSRSSAMS